MTVDLAREPPFALGALEVRPPTREVVANGRNQVLEPRIMQVLVVLARRLGDVVSRDELIDICWDGRSVGDDAIARCIAGIRRLAEAEGAFSIETIARVGYRLTETHRKAGATSDAVTSPPSRPSIAVMPFLNLSGASDQEHVADSLVVEIVESLTRIRLISVVPSGLTLSLKGKGLTAQEAARQLGARYVLEGNVRQAGERARIGVQLIDATDGAQIWTHRFEDSFNDVFALHDRVALTVADAIGPTVGLNPTIQDPTRTALDVEHREIFAMITDIRDFGAVTSELEPAEVASVLNVYLEQVGKAVLDHGGTIDKFVGDAMVAFWGAPVSRPDDGEQAVRAAIAVWRVAEACRKAPIANHPPLGATHIGLHCGGAIVGNFGGAGRVTYTAVGDAMNTAAGLESANKTLKTHILISGEAASEAMVEGLRAMGRIRLPGRAAPIEVFEPALGFPATATATLNRAYARFDAGDISALDEMKSLGTAFPDDLALSNLIRRLELVGPGGFFPLD